MRASESAQDAEVIAMLLNPYLLQNKGWLRPHLCMQKQTPALC